MGKRATSHACLRQGFKGREIEDKHGDVPIRIFRIIYGQGFAPALCASHGLRHTLAMLDRLSLDKLLADEKAGVLDAKIAATLAREVAVEIGSTSGLILGNSM
ncbi:hypothetical protein [Dyella caseinilytica]|uniref:Uncharacterized protein n=1 Tax=Dyella caseinilytica TaxID=1849581 RepID=A0ABX7GSK5_9GAMM|nr:hypothetical protein [Dyella caseinilytica]QRN53422.1 hypothetical protein ISN74_18710 [Dyella caseinilytica]GFZ86429.1 hypothetical protein GCM10011408_00960 [Dyella caseinilytica]